MENTLKPIQPATTKPNNNKAIIMALVLGGLVLLAIPLEYLFSQTSYRQTVTTNVTSTAPGSPSSKGGLLASIFGGSSAGSVDPIVSVVNVPGAPDVYRIVAGKKHWIPTAEIFTSYGYTTKIIQPISAAELDRYQRARLFVVQGDAGKTIYYLTESGMIRPILSDKAFQSYGNRMEDIITIDQKEFNFYPRNQFVYVDQPDRVRDIYQIAGGYKRYVAPAALERMQIKESEVAPINIIEMDSYPTGQPIVF